jgi:Arc/MetJ-type ribon-helix-helix transcriptional regulator
MAARRIDITLEGKLANIIDAAIACGDFAEPREVVAEALALWQLDREPYVEELNRFRAEIDAALDEPGRDLTIEEVRAHFASRRQSDEAA